MALEQTGLEFIAENAKAFTDATNSAADAVGLFESAGNTAQKTYSAFGEIVTGALRRVGEIAVDALGRAATAIYDLGRAAIDSNAEFERYTTQFGVLLGSADLAQERLAELATFGLATPFELPEIIRADKILESFGLHAAEAAEAFGFSGTEIRTIAGDMAAGTGAAFEEIARYLGQFSAGQTGMVLARFEELGIVTRKQLAEMGLEFDKAGSLVTPVEEAFGVLLTAAQDKFGGMSEAQSKTFEGMMSNLVDFKNMAIRTLGAPIFDVAKNLLGEFLTFLSSEQVTLGIKSATAAISSIADSIGNVIMLLASGDFEGDIFGLAKDDPVIGVLFEIREAGIALTDWIINVGLPAFYALGDWFKNVALPAIQPVIDAVFELWNAFAKNDPGAFFTALDGLIAALGVLWEDYLKPILEDEWSKLVAWIRGDGAIMFKEALLNYELWRSAFIDWAEAVLPGFMESLGELLGGGTAWLLTVGIPNMISALVEGILYLLGLRQLDMEESGKSFVTGFVRGFAEQGAWSPIQETINQLHFIIWYGLLRASEAAQSIFRGLGAVIAAEWEHIKERFGSAVFNFTAPMQQALIDTVNLIRNWWGGFEEAGVHLAGGLAAGIRRGVGWIMDAAIWVAEMAIRAAQSILGISSPSKLMADMVGAPMAEGIARGMVANSDVVNRAIEMTVRPAMNPMQYAGMVSNTVNNSQSWNLNVNSNQQSQGIISDFNLMQAMAA
jgi:hypothetical protein